MACRPWDRSAVKMPNTSPYARIPASAYRYFQLVCGCWTDVELQAMWMSGFSYDRPGRGWWYCERHDQWAKAA